MEATAKATVDLADLLSVTINSKQLEVVLNTILGRLDKLEDDNSNSKDKNADDNNASNNNNVDWTDVIKQLQDDLEKERLRSDNQQAAINELEEAKERHGEQLKQNEEAIKSLNDAVKDLEERKADKKKDVDPIADDVELLKKRLADMENKNAEMAARLATLEGMAAHADPEAAKDKGLTSFTDTLGDVLTRQKDLENKLNELVNNNNNNNNNKKDDDDLIDRIEKIEKALEDLNNNNRPTAAATVSADDLDALKKDLMNRMLTNSNGGNNNNNGGTDPKLLNTMLDDINALKKDMDVLQKEMNNNKNRSLATAAATPAPPTTTAAPPAGNNNGVDLTALERRVAQLEDATTTLKTNLNDHVNNTTKKLKEVDADVEDLKDSVGNLSKEIKTLGQECSKNTADCKLLHDKKADKSDLEGLNNGNTAAASQQQRSLASPSDGNNNNKNNNNGADLSQLQKVVDALDTRVSGLAQDKASKESVSQLTKDVNDMKNNLKNLQKLLGDLLAGKDGENGGAGGAAPIATNAANLSNLLLNGGNNGNTEQLEKDLKELAQRVEALEKWTKAQLIEIRGTVDHIHHSKADSAIVANKAERDYVENAMEKLMHEVENVLNATNAGLIDTLDKSLNILRDMIDGKATKQDMAKLQTLLNNNANNANATANGGDGSTPDGLASYKSYRCLGCNRPMESMRPRPMGSTMNAFTNRVPIAGGRNAPASSQGPRQTLPLPPPPANGGGGASNSTPASPAGLIQNAQ